MREIINEKVSVLLHYFSVTDGTLDFRLQCDTDTLHWTLEEVTDGLAT
jgi:hypothetical protein